MADLVVAVNIAGEQTVSRATEEARSGLASLRQEAEATTGAFGTLTSTFQRGFGLAAGFLVFDRIADSFRALSDAAIGLSANLQQTRVAFEVMTGSATQADNFLRQLARFAAETPFEFPDLVVGAQRLSAMGFKVNEIIPLMTDIGNVAAAFGGNTVESTNRIITALGQMQAKGKVQTEEMRQLSEVGVRSWQILADAAGLPIPVMQKLVEEGQVSADFFIKAFDEFSRSNFGDMMARQMQTFNGALTTVRDNLRLAVVDSFAPFFDMLTKGAVAIAAFTQSDAFGFWAGVIQGAVASAAMAFQNFVTGLAPVRDAIATFFDQLGQGNVAGAMAFLGQSIMSALGQMVQTVLSFGDAMFGAGQNLMSELAGGIIQGASNAITTAVNFVADLIASFLIGQSPPPEGPLNSIVTGGMNTIVAYADGLLAGGASVTAASEQIAQKAIEPLQAGMKELNLAFSLDEGRAKFQDALGDFENMEGVARQVTDQITTISRAMRDLDREASNVRFQMQDLKDIFDDQLKVLEDQISAVKDRYDEEARGRNQLKLEMELEELGLKSAENAAKGNREAIAQLKTQQEALKFRTQEVSIQDQLESLRKQEKDGKDVGARREMLQLKMQELDLQKNLAAQVDKEALARIAGQKEELKARQDDLAIQDRTAKIQEELDLTPMEQALKNMKREHQEMLDPLQQQLQLIDRQKFSIQSVQDSWRDLQTDIQAAMKLQKDFDTDAARAEAERKRQEAEAKKGETAAKKAGKENLDPVAKAMEKAGSGFAINTGGAPRLPTIDIADATDTAAAKAREAGVKMAGEIGAGMNDWFKSHGLAIFGGLIGLFAGGPITAAIGAALGEGIAQRFKELNIEDDVAAGFGRLVDKIKGFGQQILEIFLTIGQVMKNEWTSDDSIDPTTRAFGDFAVMVRDQVIPAVQTAAQWFMNELVPGVTGAFQAMQPFLPVLVGIGAAFATFTGLMAIVGFFTGIATAIGAALAVAGPFAAVMGLVVSSIAGGAPVLATLGAGFALLVGLLGGPVIVTVGAVAIAVGALTAAWIGNWGDIQGKTAAVVGWIQGVPGMIEGAWATVESALGQLGTFFGEVWTGITTTIGTAINTVITTVGSWIANFLTMWNTFWTTVGTFLTTLWNGTIIPFLQSAMTILYDIFLIGLGLWYVLWGQQLEAIFLTIQTVWNNITLFFQTWWPIVTDFFLVNLTNLATLLMTTWTNITTTIQTAWTAISTYFMEGFWNPLMAGINTVLTTFVNFLAATWTAIQQGVTTTWNQIFTFFRDTFWNPLLAMVTDVGSRIGGAVQQAWSNVQSTTTETWNNVKNFLINSILNPMAQQAGQAAQQLATNVRNPLVEVGKQATQWGKDLFTNFLNGLKSSGQKVIDYVNETVKKIKDAIEGIKGFNSHSPSAFGFEQGVNLFDGVKLGIESSATGALNAAQSAVAGIQNVFQGAWSGEAGHRYFSSYGRPDTNNIAEYIAQAASLRGIDPGIALRVAMSEGGVTEPARRGTFATGSSWWPFQLHYGGAGYEYLGTVAGMGNSFTAMTGWAPGDPAAWKVSVDAALDIAKNSGWGQWYGAAASGIGNWQGIRYDQGGILPEDIFGWGRSGQKYMMHAGEGIFNQGQMSALGMRKMYYTQDWADAGSGGGNTTIINEHHYHFHGTVMTEKDAAKTMRKHMINTGYSNVDIFPGLASR